MAAVLPKACPTIKFRRNSTKARLLAAAVTVRNPTEQVRNLHQLIFNNRPSNRAVLNSSRTNFIANPALVKEYSNEEKIATDKDEDERLEEEIAAVITRLRTAVESVREKEMQKYISKVGGTAPSYEDWAVVEEISTTIVNKFLERPVQYLRSRSSCCDGGRNLEQKLRDVKSLIEMLEDQSYLSTNRKR